MCFQLCSSTVASHEREGDAQEKDAEKGKNKKNH